MEVSQEIQEMKSASGYGSSDDWRFAILPQDVQHLEMYKTHVKENLILSCSIDTHINSATSSPVLSCSPQEIFMFSPTDTLAGYYEEEPIFAMSPTKAQSFEYQNIEYPTYIAPVRHISSPKKESKTGKQFPCTMCDSSTLFNRLFKKP